MADNTPPLQPDKVCVPRKVVIQQLAKYKRYGSREQYKALQILVGAMNSESEHPITETEIENKMKELYGSDQPLRTTTS